MKTVDPYWKRLESADEEKDVIWMWYSWGLNKYKLL